MAASEPKNSNLGTFVISALFNIRSPDGHISSKPIALIEFPLAQINKKPGIAYGKKNNSILSVEAKGSSIEMISSLEGI